MLLFIIIIRYHCFALINPNVKGVDVEVLYQEKKKKTKDKKKKKKKRKKRTKSLFNRFYISKQFDLH